MKGATLRRTGFGLSELHLLPQVHMLCKLLETIHATFTCRHDMPIVLRSLCVAIFKRESLNPYTPKPLNP